MLAHKLILWKSQQKHIEKYAKVSLCVTTEKPNKRLDEAKHIYSSVSKRVSL